MTDANAVAEKKPLTPREEATKKYGPQVKHWTDMNVTLYLEVGKIPEKTKRGCWVEDILRGTTLSKWSQEALLDWLDQQIPTPDGRDSDEMWHEIIVRWKIPGNWEEADILTFLKTGTRPEEVEPGVLRNDKLRNAKTIEQLSYTDFRLILNKLVDSRYSDDEIIEEIRSRMQLSAAFPSARILETLPYIEADKTMADNLLTSKLEEYRVARLGNGRNTSIKTHAAAQTGFFRLIMTVLDRPYGEFAKGWEEMLDFINVNYSNLFTEKTAAMGISESSLTATEKHILTDILSLMIHTRNPARRKMDARLYNIRTVMRNVRSERRVDNVVQFYAMD